MNSHYYVELHILFIYSNLNFLCQCLEEKNTKATIIFLLLLLLFVLWGGKINSRADKTCQYLFLLFVQFFFPLFATSDLRLIKSSG